MNLTHDIAADDYVQDVAANVDAAVRKAIDAGRSVQSIVEAADISLSCLNRMRSRTNPRQLTLANLAALAVGLGIKVEDLTRSRPADGEKS